MRLLIVLTMLFTSLSSEKIKTVEITSPKTSEVLDKVIKNQSAVLLQSMFKSGGLLVVDEYNLVVKQNSLTRAAYFKILKNPNKTYTFQLANQPNKILLSTGRLGAKTPTDLGQFRIKQNTGVANTPNGISLRFMRGGKEYILIVNDDGRLDFDSATRLRSSPRSRFIIKVTSSKIRK